MSFGMRNLTSFSVEKLHYDLRLEVLKQMKLNDGIELVKVNSGFRLILRWTPWRVFGCHVHRIFSCGPFWITKFPTDCKIKLPRYLEITLLKRIQSCDMFVATNYFSDVEAMISKQLKSVKHLGLTLDRDDISEILLKFLENFHLTIEKSASIRVKIDLLKEDQAISELFKNFLRNHMNNCENVEISCDSAAAFHFYYGAFEKTSIGLLNLSYAQPDLFEEIVQSIVNKGIPSKNPKAAFYVHTKYSKERSARIVDFLSQFPEMKSVEGESRRQVTKMAIELLEKHEAIRRPYFTEGLDLVLRRSLDSSKDCVYMFASQIKGDYAEYTDFFATSLQAQSEMMKI